MRLMIIAIMSMVLNEASGQKFDYDKAWKEVASSINMGLPKDALQKVKDIYARASSDNNILQKTKAIVNIASLDFSTDEDGLTKACQFFEDNIKKENPPYRNILHSYYAEFLTSYFANNRYLITQRTETEDAKILTITAQNLSNKIAGHYKASLMAAELLNVDVSTIQPILNEYNEKGRLLFPSLYEVLADRALSFFTGNSTGYIDVPNLKDEAAFGSTESFIATTSTNDIILLFQQVLSTEKRDNKKESLAYFDLLRLSYVYQNYTGTQKDEKYQDALRAGIKAYASTTQVGNYYAALANLLLTSQKPSANKDAYDVCQDCIAKLSTENAIPCKNILNGITQKSIDLQSIGTEIAQHSISYQLTTRNIYKVYFKIVKDDADALDERNPEGWKDIINKWPVIRSWSIDIDDKKDYNALTQVKETAGLANGKYLIIVSDVADYTGAFVKCNFQLSNIAYLEHGNTEKHYVIVDRLSGKPIKNAMVEFYTSTYDYTSQKNTSVFAGKAKSDKDGKVTPPKLTNASYKLKITYKNDVYDGLQYHYQGEDYRNPNAWTQTEIYTDRAIYRPAQVVYFKCIAYDNSTIDGPKIKPNFDLAVRLRDANGQQVDVVNLKTNAFGSASGLFTIPTGKLTGAFSIETDFGGRGIQVEEYKRPTFLVTIDTVKQAYKINDKVKLTGSAKGFAGNAISNADVDYIVMANTIMPYCYRWYMPSMPNKMIASGTVKTDQGGNFSLDFTAEKIDNSIYRLSYGYTVTVTVKDQNGEARLGNAYVSVAERSTFIETNLKPQIDLSVAGNYTVMLKNVNGAKVSGSGNYTIYKLKEDNKILNQVFNNTSSYYKSYYDPTPQISPYQALAVEKNIGTRPYASGDVLALKDLKAGIYKIVIAEASNQADSLTEYILITNYSKNDYPKINALFFIQNKDTYKVGDEMVLNLASGLKHKIYYILKRGDKVLQSGWTKTSTIKYKITAADKGGLTLLYSTVLDNHQISNSVFIKVPWYDKELQIAYEVFRDKMDAGSQAKFKIKIKGLAAKANAEVLAAMYDLSLDQFMPNNWNKILFAERYTYDQIMAYDFAIAYGQQLNYMWNNPTYTDEQPIILPSLLPLPTVYAGGRVMYKSRNQSEAGIEAASDAMAAPAATAAPPPNEKFDGLMATEANLANTKNEGAKENDAPLSPRTNLKETVFFYPHLTTNSDGSVDLTFTNNEALTKWKIMILAHTQDLAMGYDEHIVQTTKDLLITAHSPRYVRQGDLIYFTARVSNLSSQSQTAQANIDLKDALNDATLNSYLVGPATVEVVLAPGESKAVSWGISIPKNALSTLRYTVSLSNKSFSDAESSLLPIISSKILATESMAMYLNGLEKKTYEFASMKNANGNQSPVRYVVEVSSHPIWYAIQAMPYVMRQEHTNATQLANRYYVNALSEYIVKQYPMIQETYNQWLAKNDDALKSNLQKNEELKSANLDESPWVSAALEEATQKKNVASLFDLNTIQQDNAQTLTTLASLQLPNGAFSWYPGGRHDFYSTLYIANMLNKVYKKTADEGILAIANKASAFIVSDLKRQYSDLLKNQTANQLKSLEEYQPEDQVVLALYVISSSQSIAAFSEKEISYFYKQAIKYWNKYGIFTQSNLGSVDFRLQGKTYLEIANSLIQKSFTKDELGMYWNEGNGYRWYEMPIERHAALMEFFHEIKSSAADLDKMKVWLIKNKQSNHWTTANASAAAISALLLTNGPKQASLDNDLPVIAKVGAIDLPNKSDIQVGTIYYKKTWTESQIEKNMSTIYLSNPNENIAWGAAYYQYFADIDKISASNQSPLKISKKLYKELVNGKQKTLQALDANSRLKPGDVLVSRIIIETDRTISYIHVKDVRGSGVEPYDAISGYKYQSDFGYYESIRDQSTNYFIDHLPKGNHVFESRHRVVHKGTYVGGLATIQSFYAPEYGSKTEGDVIVVE